MEETLLHSTSVEILSLSTNESNATYFEQLPKKIYTKESEKYMNGIPTNRAYELIRQALLAGHTAQRWGN
jgi:hypothetical protein